MSRESNMAERCVCGKPAGHVGWLVCMGPQIAEQIKQSMPNPPPITGGLRGLTQCPRCGHEF